MPVANKNNKKLIVIAGPTAVGKTNVAIQIAQHFSTSILSADARQCFKEMNIGTAKPTSEELSIVNQYFINSHHITDDMSAGIYESYALDVLKKLFLENNIVVLCGGTGLYIKALLHGMDSLPPIDKKIDLEVTNDYNKYGFQWLHDTLKLTDNVYFNKGEMNNPSRMLRALIFHKTHNKSILEYRIGNRTERDFETIGIGLELPREELYNRINHRVDVMMENGLLDEVSSLVEYKEGRNLLTVGYQEFYEMGDFPLTQDQIEMAVDKIKQHSRNYAKRQLTWFKNKENFEWFSPFQINEIIQYCESNISLTK